MKQVTVRDYINGYTDNKRVYMREDKTREVTGIRWPETDPWIVCGKENAGFGLSFCVHYGTPLFVED